MNCNKHQIDLKDTVAIGISEIVGSGIFAILGLAVEFVKGGTPLSFLIAVIISFFAAYSYVWLSLYFPDKGGTAHTINKGIKILFKI